MESAPQKLKTLNLHPISALLKANKLVPDSSDAGRLITSHHEFIKYLADTYSTSFTGETTFVAHIESQLFFLS